MSRLSLSLRALVPVVSALGLSSCLSKIDYLTHTDIGDACIADSPEECEFDEQECFLAGESEALVAKKELTVHVKTRACMSSCSKVLDTNCRTSVVGSEITLSSSAEFKVEDDSCEIVCNEAIASCTLPPLEAGAYTVVHGGKSALLEIPGRISCEESVDVADAAGGAGGATP